MLTWRWISFPALLLIGSPGAPATVSASSSTQLATRLKSVRSGDTILLEPGDYGKFATSAVFEASVTIVSRDPSRAAHFDGLQLSAARNLRFSRIDFGRSGGGDAAWARIVDISGSANISFDHSLIHGSLDGDPTGDISGVKASESSGLSFSNVTFEELSDGIVVSDTTGLKIERSRFRLIRSDAIDIPGVGSAVIAGNRFSDFRPATGDHPDAIQCWTRKMKSACHDIEIRGNLFEGSIGREMQAVFFGDEDQYWNEGRGYRDVTVSDNLIITSMYNALCFAPTRNLTLTSNVIVTSKRAPMQPKICVEGPASLIGNEAPLYSVDRKLASPRGNKTIEPESDASLAHRVATWESAHADVGAR